MNDSPFLSPLLQVANGGGLGMNQVASAGQQTLAALGSMAAPPPEPAAPSYGFNSATRQFFAKGRTFGADDYQAAVESADQPGTAAPLPQGFQPLSEQQFGGYVSSIRNPSRGTLAARNFDRGVDTLQLLAGYGTALAGSNLGLEGVERSGMDLAAAQVEDLRKTQPFERQFTDIDSASAGVDWFVANLAQQGPNFLSSALAALGGAIVGGTAGGGPNPITAAGGAVLGLFGKKAVQQAALAAAQKYARGEALDATEDKILREAAGLTLAAKINEGVIYGTSGGASLTAAQMTAREQAKQVAGRSVGAEILRRQGVSQARTGGAALASGALGYGMSTAELYGESVEAGDPSPNAAMLLGIPGAALELFPEFLAAARVFGGPAARILANRPYRAGFKAKGAEVLRRAGTGVTIGAAAEGTTEFGQELLNFAINPNVDLNSPEGVKRAINAFAAGAGAGGALGLANVFAPAATGAPTDLLNRNSDPSGAAEIDAVNRPQPPAAGGALALSGPGPVPLLGGPGTAMGAPIEQVTAEFVTPGQQPIAGAISAQQRLALPPPGAVLEVEGQPNFVVDSAGNVRAAQADDTVIGVTRGFVPATAPGEQGVLNVFPEGQTTARDLRGMMGQPTQPVDTLQPQDVPGEAPVVQDFSQDVLPLDTGLPPRFFKDQRTQPPAAGTIGSIAPGLARLRRRLESGPQFDAAERARLDAQQQQATEQQRRALEQELLAAGTAIPSPTFGVTTEQAAARWRSIGGRGFQKKFENLDPQLQGQWVDAINLYNNGELALDALRDIRTRLAAVKKGETIPTVVTGAVSIMERMPYGPSSPGAAQLREMAKRAKKREAERKAQQKEEATRAAKKPEATKVSPAKQPATGAENLRRGAAGKTGRTARTGTAAPAAAKPATSTVPRTRREAVQETVAAKPDERRKEIFAAIDKALKDGVITAKDRLKLVADFRKDGDADLVVDELARAREAARNRPRNQRAGKKAEALKKPAKKSDLTYASVRAEVQENYDNDVISMTQYDTLISAIERAKSPPEDIRARMQYFIRGGKVTRAETAEARGLRDEQQDTEKAQAETIDAATEDVVGDLASYREVNIDANAARVAGKITNIQFRELQDMISERKPIAAIRKRLQLYGGRSAQAQQATTGYGGPFNEAEQVALADALEGMTAIEVAEYIANNSESKFYAAVARRVAAMLRKLERTGTKFSFQIVEKGQPTDADFARSSSQGMAILQELILRGPVTIYTIDVFIAGPTMGSSRAGVTERTILHELIHAASMGALKMGRLKISDGTGLGATFNEFADLFSRVVREFDSRVAQDKAGTRPLTKIERSIFERRINAMEDMDEMLAWGMTDGNFQQWLQSIPAGPNSKVSLFDRFVNLIRRLFGIERTDVTALDELIRIFDKLMTDETVSDFRIVAAKQTGGGRQTQPMMESVSSRAEELIDGMPSSLRDPLRTVTDTFGGSGVRFASRFGMLNQLVDLAVRKGIKSARRFERLIRDRGAMVERNQEQFVRWAEEHARLPAEFRGTGLGTVNGLIEAMTRADKWAFQPDYFRGDETNTQVNIDPELEARYAAMPAAAQKSVRDAFRLMYDSLKQLQESVIELTVTEYDALIANTTDPKQKKELEDSKRNSLTQFRTLLNIDPTTPYAPLSRYGNWVVVGRSDELLQAMADNDYKRIRQLEESADHYFVDMAETRAEAARMAREVRATYGGKDTNVEFFEKSQAREDMFGGRDMMYAFQRLTSFVESAGMNPELTRQLRNSAVQLQIMAMSSSSVRKAELRRRLIASGDLDMVRNILSRGRSAAHFIGSIHKNSEILETLRVMDEETKARDGNREDRQAIYNSIMARYVDGLQSRVDNTLADTLTSYTSVWMLGFSPSYYIQQALQNMMITVPVMAGIHGYDASLRALRAGYAQVTKAWDGSGLTQQLDLDKVDERYRALAMFLAESGELDVGINKEMGLIVSDGNSVIGNAFRRVMDRIRGLTRKIEAINRLSAGIAMYDLELAAARGGEAKYDAGAYRAYTKDFAKAHPDMTPLTARQFAAANGALRIITDTHGNYSMENAPPILRTSLGRVLGQFQKFRIMMAGLYIREFYNAYMDPTLSPQERRVARRTLMYLAGHAAIVGGMLGTPAAAVFVLVYNMLSGDDDERGDFERDIRSTVGNEAVANLLLRGVPSLFGVDVSGTLGQGALLSVAPYTDLPSDRESYAKFVLSMAGPAIGGVGGNAADAIGLMNDGNYYKALEKLVPRGIGAASRSFREATQGETTGRGDTLTQPIDINAVESFWAAIGLQPISRVNRQFARNDFFKDQRFYKDRSADIKTAYVDAAADKDSDTMAALKLEWRGLQQARRDRGYKAESVVELVAAPRERALREQRTVGGVQFTPATKKRAERSAELAGSAR